MTTHRVCVGCRYGSCIRCDHDNCACGSKHPWDDHTATTAPLTAEQEAQS